MSDLPPSEFGGDTNELGIHPFPHHPTAAESLRAVYQTGDDLGGEGGVYFPRDEDSETMRGLISEEEQRAIRKSEGALEKGQVWEEFQSGS